MSKLEDLVFTSNLNNDDLIHAIKSEILQHGFKKRVYDASKDAYFNKEIRQCGVSWIPVNGRSLTEKILTDLIKRVNKFKKWDFKLSGWQCEIQYTYYYQSGHHYDWHVDTLDSKLPSQKRLISIVYCLSSSDLYEGGELELKYEHQTSSIKLNAGDFIIFPSHLVHRVKKLKSGERETLVGWYQ